ncbi:MAG: DUF3326 domain-containing protein [Candidatus Caenarcaniphilales bacterium]|nr:DUF3326 domain-containing protein [Candidatus Caenarcaniphilales bacterium]
MLYKLNLQELNKNLSLLENIETKLKVDNKELLRWGAISFDEQDQCLTFEVQLSEKQGKRQNTSTQNINTNTFSTKIVNLFSEKKIGAFVIPTGLGCTIGGFGGDANLAANIVASEFDYLIVNPNVINGGAWQNLAPNMLYVEGYILDQFMKGLVGLRRSTNNKIGIIFDKKIPPEQLWREKQVIEAAQTIWGLNVCAYETTDEPLKAEIEILEGNISSGNLKNPEVLIKAAERLKGSGAQAIAVISYLEEELSDKTRQEDNYSHGQGPDPIGGIEAVISHTISRHFALPCANAPTFFPDKTFGYTADPKVAPEIASYSFLPSVLKGLSKAPQIILPDELQIGDLTVHNLKAFVGPADCWGGSSFLSALENPNINAYAIQSNKTGINLGPETFGFEVFKPSNYLELIGYLRAGDLGFTIDLARNHF